MRCEVNACPANPQSFFTPPYPGPSWAVSRRWVAASQLGARAGGWVQGVSFLGPLCERAAQAKRGAVLKGGFWPFPHFRLVALEIGGLFANKPSRSVVVVGLRGPGGVSWKRGTPPSLLGWINFSMGR